MRLTDCACYDISRVDTMHKPLLVWGSRGNLWDVSSDRRVVLFSHQTVDLWVGVIGHSTARKLLADGDVYSAELSPNRQWVAFTSDSCGLCVIPAAGGSVRALGVGHVLWASWSPDSTKLVVGVEGGLLLVNADGSGQRPVGGPVQQPFGPGLVARSMWSPSGDRIVYTAEANGSRLVHVLRLADDTDTVIAPGSTPVWSPDGTKLAFMWKEKTLAVIGADGRGLHVVDRRATDGYAYGAAWSPGGRWLAYRTTEDRGEFGTDNVFIAHPEGTHRRRLVRGDDNEEIGPICWSQDGQTILYAHTIQFGD